MPRARTWILFGVVVIAVAAIAWLHHAPDIGAWTRFRYFRCMDCDGPASVNPELPEQWGCRACGFATYRITERFRITGLADYPDIASLFIAAEEAGDHTSYDGTHPTPVSIWSKAGGGRSGHVTTGAP